MSRYPGGIITKSPATPTGPTTAGRAPGVWRLDEVAYWIKQGVWPDANIQAPDTFFPYVSLLLSTTSLGNANNNLFVDSSGAFNPISRNGNTTQGSFTPYGASWSNYFNGSNAYLTSATSSAYAMGTGDFTIEGWFFTTASADQALWDNRTSTSSAVGVACRLINSTNTLRVILNNTALFTTSQAVPLNQWNHIAVVRASGTVTAYLNGTAMTGGSASGTTNITDTNMWIGKLQDAGFFYNGYISNVRVVKGTAVYTANFTPSTTPLTAITNTSLLTCQSNRFRDASTNNFTVTPNGNTSVTEFSPFSPAYPGISYNQSDIQYWSGYFDGSGDFLSIADNAAFDFGTGDFTIECWVYLNAYNGTFGSEIFSAHTFGVSADYIFNINTTGKLFFQIGSSSSLFTSTNSVPLREWAHIAVVRSGNTFTPYINGVNAGGAATTSSAVNATRTLTIGSDLTGNAGASLNGYISNHRVVKGTAVYTSAFTPPTAPLTAISGTSLLVCQSAAFTDNSTNNFVVTINGNTTVTGNSPFNTVGYWSNYFDGATSYLSVPVTSSAFTLNGDFTIEAWVYRAPSGYMTMFDTRSGGNYTDWVVGLNTSGQFDFVTVGGAGVRITTTETVAPNVWTHVACVRQGSTVKVYLNGVASVNTATYGTTITPASSVGYIGASKDPVYSTGYLSNLRLVKGTAVYTANFTPPTAPLTAISGTSLLTCQNGSFKDNSTNAFAITPVGTPSTQSFDPFYASTIASNGGSMYFDGTGDFLTVPDAQILEPGSSNLTWEMWINTTSSTQYATLYSRTTASFATGMWSLMINIASSTAGDVGLFVADYSVGSPLLQTTGVNVRDGAWHHIAVVRSGSSWVLYVDGVSRATGTFSGTIANISGGPSIGRDEFYTRNYLGYISNLRITTGSAIYTAAFTPPTAPVTPSASTALLVNGMNAGAYDATAINDMETVGDAKVTTAVSKFGGSSVALDGTGDYLQAPYNDALQFGAGDFTVEFWINAAASGSYNQVVGTLVSGTENGTWRIGTRFNSLNNLYFARGNGSGFDEFNIAANANDGAWHHVACTRSSGLVRLFLDGTVVASSTISGTCTSANPLRVGYNQRDNVFVNGYLDDLRITKGVARYTANFTPPTQAFPPY